MVVKDNAYSTIIKSVLKLQVTKLQVTIRNILNHEENIIHSNLKSKPKFEKQHIELRVKIRSIRCFKTQLLKKNSFHK